MALAKNFKRIENYFKEFRIKKLNILFILVTISYIVLSCSGANNINNPNPIKKQY